MRPNTNFVLITGLSLLIVFFSMKRNPVFDEPEDAMIYMIVVALGFAAVENILVMNSFAPVFFFDPTQPLYILALRFDPADVE